MDRHSPAGQRGEGPWGVGAMEEWRGEKQKRGCRGEGQGPAEAG